MFLYVPLCSFMFLYVALPCLALPWLGLALASQAFGAHFGLEELMYLRGSEAAARRRTSIQRKKRLLKVSQIRFNQI